MRRSKTKSPPQRAKKSGRQPKAITPSSPQASAAVPAQPALAGAGAEPQVYSVNTLSKLLGRDRRTIDKAVAAVAPARVEGKTKFFRLADVEQALRTKGSQKLRDEKFREEIRKLRIANDREEGKLVLKTAVAASVMRCVGPAAVTLEQRLVNEYPTAVAGLDVPQARIYGRRICDELLEFFRGLAKEWA